METVESPCECTSGKVCFSDLVDPTRPSEPTGSEPNWAAGLFKRLTRRDFGVNVR